MNTGSSVRRRRHREADLAGLLDAAEKVFSEKGYHATSIRDIAREAGFGVGGVYQFFDSKDDLYLRVVEIQWEFFFGLLDQARQAEGARQKLEALTAAMFRTFEERRGFFRLFLSERGRLTAAFSDQIAERVGGHTRRLREQLIELMQNSGSRFILLGEGQFLAVSQECHRRLKDLGANAWKKLDAAAWTAGQMRPADP